VKAEAPRLMQAAPQIHVLIMWSSFHSDFGMMAIIRWGFCPRALG
jgi:hypothetical protein